MYTIVLGLLFSQPGLWAQNRNATIEDEELSTIRAISVTKRATFADLCKLVLIQRGELEKYETDEARCARLSELGIYDTASVEYVHLAPLKKGAVAKAAINTHGIPKSLMFRLTRTEWYALQNAEAEGLMNPGSNSWDTISGEELIIIMDEALARGTEKSEWMQPINPYKEFGFDSYAQMEENARKEREKSEKK